MEIIDNSSVQNLLEIEKIKALKATYCRFVDTKQWEAFGKLLVEDVQLTFKDPKGDVLYSFNSSEEMVQLTASVLSNAVTVHHVHNPEIEILSASEARAIWALEDIIIFPDGADAPFKTMHGYGHYHETLVKIRNEWKIKTLTLERLKLEHTF